MRHRSRPHPGSALPLLGRLALAALPGLAGCAGAGVPSEPVRDFPADAWNAIERAEFARRATPELLAAARSRDTEIRGRAVLALGRLPWPECGAEVTRALLRALDDPDVNVRALAAFALGVRRDPSAGDRLARLATDFHAPDREPIVRARALEAASKLDRPDLVEALLFGLEDPSPRVRLEAAVGTHRWPADAPDAAAVDAALLAALAREPSKDVRWRILFALQRRGAAAARDAFLGAARSTRTLERLYAVRGLARHDVALPPTLDALRARAEPVARPTDAAVRDALVAALRDADWRVAAEAARGLGARHDADALAALVAAARHPSPHVRTEVATALALQLRLAAFGRDSAWSRANPDAAARETPELPEGLDAAVEALARDDRSEQVRAAALDAWLLGPGAARPAEEAAAALPFDSEQPLLRAAAARALGRSAPWSAAVADALVRATSDPHPAAAGAAVDALGLHLEDADVRALVRSFLTHADNGLRLAAVLALANAPVPEDLPHLERAFASARGDIGPEVRFNAVRAAAAVATPRARSLCVLALGDTAPHVRRVARDEIEARWPDFELPPPSVGPAAYGPDPDRAPLRGRDWDVLEENPWVAIETTRGTMVFEVFPRLAPWHVHNFLALAAQDHYDRLTFHRVVPDFVIQGGDYRGDGNGGVTVTGVPLRHEIRGHKYARGSLGMPRNEDWDSGGSQIFVTHRPTPHLDGRYTIFGELRRGHDVLDRIELGDRILDVRIVEPE